MANPKLTIEFYPGGHSSVKFSSIAGVSPGRIERAARQARQELTRLCGLAAAEARQRREESKKEKELPKEEEEVSTVEEEAPTLEEAFAEEAEVPKED